ncbi:DUF4124 domain-containing protein [Dyella japonica]|uniref:DUF4124 domain-containing protein n=1 Tax=Dyella japonica A8 TaxID=1217721 RepID=A0A075JY90_9GAMM|nr:DUF4124 domain-containing protein [Dyella japonica]AIF46869.1 hypothetical protein HY57_06115 [Dyella japonica A8]
MMRACLVLLLFLLPLCVMAQGGIHRCIGADGNPLFTDQPCAALQATPVNPPPAPTSAPPGLSNAAPVAPPAITCATSVDQLRQSMVDAFAARDPNRLAGLMIWNGVGRDAVVADIRSLGALMQRPLLDVNAPGDDSVPPSGAGEDAPLRQGGGDPDRLIVHTAANDGSGTPHESRFTIVHRSGCLWLRASG